ncbi:MAG TPA: phage tail protein [Blastocatellia bacterium]|nr:phage tail protein [Blastocatellia bacterium]
MSTANQPPNRLLEYLPAIFHEDPLLERFLRAFEKLLIDRDDGVEGYTKSLEETIDDIPELFNPRNTEVVRSEFLPWLASWTALALRADLEEPVQREFIANIISRYRWRGTRDNLQALLNIFVKGKHKVTETTSGEFQIGKASTVGVDTWIGGGPAHFFYVTVSLPRLDSRTLERQTEITRSLIELEKPAHTVYSLEIKHPSIKIGEHSTVGVDTLIGTGTED